MVFRFIVLPADYFGHDDNHRTRFDMIGLIHYNYYYILFHIFVYDIIIDIVINKKNLNF